MTFGTLTVAAFTNRGLRRRTNEDCIGIGSQILAADMTEPTFFGISEMPTTLLLADGLGGHGHGATASQKSVEFLQSQAPSLTESSSIYRALNALNEDVLNLREHSNADAPMGTTIVGAVIRQDGFLTFNLGDSRAYLHSHGQLIQISHDDSPTAIGIKAQRAKHLVTQSIGGAWFSEEIDPHCAEHPPLQPDERLLLCSDGLTRMVDDAEIERILGSRHDIKTIIKDLITATFAAGAEDNFSIIIASNATSYP